MAAPGRRILRAQAPQQHTTVRPCNPGAVRTMAAKVHGLVSSHSADQSHGLVIAVNEFPFDFDLFRPHSRNVLKSASRTTPLILEKITVPSGDTTA